jgi:L-rhamnose-H+ transport protein
VQLTRNRTWRRLLAPGAGRVLLLAAMMAVLHNAAIFLFGLGWIHIGDLGVSVGYPVFMSLAILVGNAHGFRTGEWKGASRQSIAWILAGIVLLVLGVCLLAQGRAMLPA